MNIINKLVSSGRTKFLAGVLADQNISLAVDDIDEFFEENVILCGFSLKLASNTALPSAIAVTIVDNNTIIESSSGDFSYPLIRVTSEAGDLNTISLLSEATIKLVDGVPNISLVVNSNDPVLTSTMKVTHRIIAKHKV